MNRHGNWTILEFHDYDQQTESSSVWVDHRLILIEHSHGIWKRNAYQAINKWVIERQIKTTLKNKPRFTMTITSPIDPTVFCCIFSERISIDEQLHFLTIRTITNHVTVPVSKSHWNWKKNINEKKSIRMMISKNILRLQ